MDEQKSRKRKQEWEVVDFHNSLHSWILPSCVNEDALRLP